MPYSDTCMRYDAQKHRYVLLETYVLEQMNVDLREILDTSTVADTANAIDKLLDRLSMEVYSYVYRIVPHRYATERSLALDNAARPYILRALEEQLLYVLNNGDILAYSGVNLTSGATIDKSRILASGISPLAEDALYESGYLCAVVPRYKRDISPNYEEEGY